MKCLRNALFCWQCKKFTFCQDEKNLYRGNRVYSNEAVICFFALRFVKNCSHLGQNKAKSIKKWFKRKSQLTKVLKPDLLSLSCNHLFFVGRTVARRKTPDRSLGCQAHRTHKIEKIEKLCETIAFVIRHCSVTCYSKNTPKWKDKLCACMGKANCFLWRIGVEHKA